MCDYSLQGIKNRLAEEGEILVVHRFYSGSKGLTSPYYLKPPQEPKTWTAILSSLFSIRPQACAVCIPDGARLILTDISPAFQQTFGVSSLEVVTFRQLSANSGTYRDAVEFANGEKLRLQELEDGQRVEVLALSSEALETEGVARAAASRPRQIPV